MRGSKRLPIRLNWAQEQQHGKCLQRNGLNKFRFQPQLVSAEDNVRRLAGPEGNTNIITVLGKGEPSGTTWILVHARIAFGGTCVTIEKFGGLK